MNWNFNVGCRVADGVEKWSAMNDDILPPECEPVRVCRLNHPTNGQSEMSNISNDVPRCRQEAERRYKVTGVNWNFNIGCQVLGKVIDWTPMNGDNESQISGACR